MQTKSIFSRAAAVLLALSSSAVIAQKAAAPATDAAATWPANPQAPKGAPNVVLILIDDVGFSATSTFGGVIETPNFDRLAANGLRYNAFHVNSLCSPTRAALLSGRNNHEVGFGTVAEAAAAYPGYNARWTKSAASLAEVLKLNGYNTAAATARRMDLQAWHRWADFIPMVTDSTTSPAMYGNGPQTGTVRTITRASRRSR